MSTDSSRIRVHIFFNLYIVVHVVSCFMSYIYIVIEKMTELVNLFGTATFISICREWWRQRSDGNWWNCLEDPEMGNWIKAPRLHWLLRIKTNQMWFPQATRTSTIQLIQHVENKHSHVHVVFLFVIFSSWKIQIPLYSLVRVFMASSSRFPLPPKTPK